MLTPAAKADCALTSVDRRAKLRRFGLLMLLGLELVTAALFCSTSTAIAVDVLPHGSEPTGLLAILDHKFWLTLFCLGAPFWAKDVYRLARSSRHGMPSMASPLLLHILIISACTLAAALSANSILKGIADLG